MSLTEREIRNKQLVSDRKPIVAEKIKTIPQRIKDGKSIALMQLQLSYLCPLKCRHCAIKKFKENIKEDMSLENIKKIADEAHDYGILAICISGGEPLAFPNISEIIDAIGPERFVLSMDTNGVYLSEDKVKWLVDKGVDRIHLSMDGTELNHEQFRNAKGLWGKCVDALQYTKKYNLGVVVNIVVTKDLIKNDELVKQLEYLKQFNEHASLIYAKNVGEFEEAKDQVLDSNDFEYLETLTKKYNCSTHLTVNNGQDIGCLCYKRHFSILPDGQSLPCPWIPISMGNVLTEGLVTVIERGLNNPWFSFDNKFTCHSGNSDSFFYQNIVSQIEKFDEYPVPYKKIDWHLEIFKK